MGIYNQNDRRLSSAAPRDDSIDFFFGLDTETPKWAAEKGSIRQSQNYELAILGGIQDIAGYEAFDGRPKPSDAVYYLMSVTITGSLAVGDTLDQLATGASGEIIGIVTNETPSYVVMTKVTGTFNNSDDLSVSAVVQATPLSIATANSSANSLLHATYLNTAADLYRADIGSVGGVGASGDVLGLVFLDGVWYAFRNNAAGTATNIYKNSASGWTQVALNNEISFTAGNDVLGEPAEGLTLTRGGVTATILRVVTESGDWTAGTAAGRIIIGAVTGGPYTAGAATINTGTPAALTLSGAESAQVIQPDGIYDFDVDEIGGSGNKRIYGANRVDYGFEFDGSVFVHIHTGMPTDTPNHVRIHKNYLFLSFGASAQHSGIGSQYTWTPVFGSGELALGDTITGFQSEPGNQTNGALNIFSRNTTHTLYGSSPSDWNLVKYRDELGAIPRSIQQISSTMFQDDRGITNLTTAQEYGNFSHATITEKIKRHFVQRKNLLVDSCIVREKNQYRLFYSDKSAYYITISGNNVLGIMPQVFKHTVTCAASYEDEDGSEQVMFGSDDGFVYQMEKGTSFNGDNIEAFCFTNFTHNGYKRWLKKYLGIALEVEGTGYSELSLSHEIGYRASEIPQPLPENKIVDLVQSRWDSFYWDAFVWDGESLKTLTARLSGSAQNIALVFRKNSDKFNPVRISGAHLRFKLRRRLRE